MLNLLYKQLHKGGLQMGLFDLLTFGLLGLENAKTRADDLKVSTTNFQQNNQCDLYFYHAETYHSLFYAEACSAGGYCCFGTWCRMNGYWGTAYQYLKIAAYDSTLRSRAEFARVCFVLGKYEEAIAAGNRYKYVEGWLPTFYMALSYYMLGETETCKELLLMIVNSKEKLLNEPSYARGFLQSEYGMTFEEGEKSFLSDFFNEITYGISNDFIIPIDRNTALEIASAKEDTMYFHRTGFVPFSMGRTPLWELKAPKNGYTSSDLVKIDNWIRKLPQNIEEGRNYVRKSLEENVKSWVGVQREEALEDTRYLFNMVYDPQTGKFVDVPRILPSPFDIEAIEQLLETDRQMYR